MTRILGLSCFIASHRKRVARIDIRDAGSEDDPLGARREVGRMRERLAPDRLGNPERPVAVLFDRARDQTIHYGRKTH